MKKRKTRKEIRELQKAGPPLCACGECGLPTKWSILNKCWNEFIHNHHWINKKHSSETKEKQSKAKAGENNPMYGTKKINKVEN